MFKQMYLQLTHNLWGSGLLVGPVKYKMRATLQGKETIQCFDKQSFALTDADTLTCISVYNILSVCQNIMYSPEIIFLQSCD